VSFGSDILLDCHLWLWWYDRGGVVQSHGLNFVDDFPYLLVLLAVLKKFDEQAWGLCSNLFTKTLDNLRFEFRLGDTTFDMPIDPSALPVHLYGRASAVVKSVKSNYTHPFNVKRTLADEKMVVKISWPESKLSDEGDLLRLAYAIGSQDYARTSVRGHLPVLFASLSWPTARDQAMDELLQVKDKDRLLTRCLRVLVFEELHHIWELGGVDFTKTWLDCFRCQSSS
jgi:hypothetical protein